MSRITLTHLIWEVLQSLLCLVASKAGPAIKSQIMTNQVQCPTLQAQMSLENETDIVWRYGRFLVRRRSLLLAYSSGRVHLTMNGKSCIGREKAGAMQENS